MTGWGILAYSIVPVGIVLMLLLLSDANILMYIAAKVLSAPITLGSLRLNVATIATAFCACLTVLTYSGVQRSMSKYVVNSNQPQILPRDYDTRLLWVSFGSSPNPLSVGFKGESQLHTFPSEFTCVSELLPGPLLHPCIPAFVQLSGHFIKSKLSGGDGFIIPFL